MSDLDDTLQSARLTYDDVLERVKALRDARAAEDDAAIDDAEERIREKALTVEVRSGWQAVGAEPEAPVEYRILLSTGGPAFQITGKLTEYGDAETAVLQYQDWFKPWTDWHSNEGIESVLLDFARCFYFWEG